MIMHRVIIREVLDGGMRFNNRSEELLRVHSTINSIIMLHPLSVVTICGQNFEVVDQRSYYKCLKLQTTVAIMLDKGGRWSSNCMSDKMFNISYTSF